MDRRKPSLVAATALGLAAASAALVLGVQTTGLMVDAAPAESGQPGTPTSLHGTKLVLPDGYVAFSLDGATLVPVGGDASKLDKATLDAIQQQLQASPAGTFIYVDLASLDEAGLTTAMATATPTNGVTVGATNEATQQWLGSLFPTSQGTLASAVMPGVPNASLSYAEAVGETGWQVTEYVFGFADATVSYRLSTVDDTGQARVEFEQMLASQSR